MIVDRLTKLAHLIQLRVSCLLKKLAQLYVHDVARPQGMSKEVSLYLSLCLMSHFVKVCLKHWFRSYGLAQLFPLQTARQSEKDYENP